MTLDELRDMPGFIYMASPYSLFRFGISSAAYDAKRHAAHLINQGFRVFSPIAHSHEVSWVGGIDPLDHRLWLDQNEPFMRAACALIIVKMDGWKESVGIAQEAAYFQSAGKPIIEIEALA